jgi:hypothetical protein
VDIADLENHFSEVKNKLSKSGMMWISWRKGRKGFNREVIREYGLSQGLVDVKVASYDEKWSGLKFVWRVKDR